MNLSKLTKGEKLNVAIVQHRSCLTKSLLNFSLTEFDTLNESSYCWVTMLPSVDETCLSASVIFHCEIALR